VHISQGNQYRELRGVVTPPCGKEFININCLSVSKKYSYESNLVLIIENPIILGFHFFWKTLSLGNEGKNDGNF